MKEPDFRTALIINLINAYKIIFWTIFAFIFISLIQASNFGTLKTWSSHDLLYTIQLLIFIALFIGITGIIFKYIDKFVDEVDQDQVSHSNMRKK